MEKQAAARILFNEGTAQKDIARILRVTEGTVSKWARDEDWRGSRIANAIARESAEEGIWHLINYQIEQLTAITKEWKENAGKKLKNPDGSDGGTYPRNKLIDKGDIDALQKMFAAVKGKQQTWTHYVSVTRELMEHLQNSDSELAKRLIEHVDQFLNDKRQKL